MKKVSFFLVLILLSITGCTTEKGENLDDRLVNTKWQTEDISYEVFFGKYAYRTYEFTSTTSVSDYVIKNGTKVKTYGTYTYLLEYPKLYIYPTDSTVFEYDFKDDETIVRTGANEYAAYMKYIKQ